MPRPPSRPGPRGQMPLYSLNSCTVFNITPGAQMADDLVLCTVEEGVALLTLNRPERKNAWTIAMEERYFDLLRTCERDPDVRTIVVTGAGTAFCPGLDAQDLEDIAVGGRQPPSRARRPAPCP